MLKQIAVIFTLTLGLFFFLYFKMFSSSLSPTPISINQVATSGLPITATFVTPDMRNEDFPGLIKELKSVGIDTIILDISEVTSTNCGSTFTDTYFLDNPSSGWASLIRAALTGNLKMYLGPRGQSYTNECLSPLKGTPTNIATPMGHSIAHFMTSVDKLKIFLANEGVSWTDPRFAGLYIPEEIPTAYLTDKDPGNITYFKEVSSRAKSYGKPLLISPVQAEETNYSKSLEAFKNIIGKTDITIIAPQDSMGSGATRTAAASAEHFRALADAKAAYPAKNIEIWANIELFQHPSEDPTWTSDNPSNPPRLIPAPFTRVNSQIEAARPYVSKMTSWLYQHNMMVLPAAGNLTSILTWNPMYTPAQSTRRTKLRADYLAAYGGTTTPSSTPTPSPTPKPSLTPTPSPSPSSNPSTTPAPSPNPADLVTTGDTATDQVNVNDYNTFKADYGKTGVPGFVPADMKKDGAVNIFDYNILVANFDK